VLRSDRFHVPVDFIFRLIDQRPLRTRADPSALKWMH